MIIILQTWPQNHSVCQNSMAFCIHFVLHMLNFRFHSSAEKSAIFFFLSSSAEMQQRFMTHDFLRAGITFLFLYKLKQDAESSEILTCLLNNYTIAENLEHAGVSSWNLDLSSLLQKFFFNCA